MAKERNDGGPAGPIRMGCDEPGMSVRDAFALAFASWADTDRGHNETDEQVASKAYNIAQAMVNEKRRRDKEATDIVDQPVEAG